MLHIIEHLCAENDRNGNPQRCFVVWGIVADAHLVGVFDEGYEGRFAVPEDIRNEHGTVFLERVNVTGRTYRSWLRKGRWV